MPRLKFDNSTIKKIKHMSSEEYYDFLKRYILEDLSEVEKNKVTYRNGEYYKYFSFAPVGFNGEIIEDDEKHAVRIRLRDDLLREIRNKWQTEGKLIKLVDDNDIVSEQTIKAKLRINKKTLLNLSACKQVFTVVIGKKFYVNKESVLRYLDDRHYEGVCSIGEEYPGIISLRLLQERDAIRDAHELEKFKASPEYQKTIIDYLTQIPDDLKVYKDPMKNIDFNFENIDYFNEEPKTPEDLYNFYLKKVEEKHEELPQLHPLRHFIPSLKIIMGNEKEVSEKTMIRYCEKGIIPFYRIGTRHMISEEDWLENYKKIIAYKANFTPSSKKAGYKSALGWSVFQIDINKIDQNKLRNVPTELLNEYYAEYKKYQNSIMAYEDLKQGNDYIMQADPDYVKQFFTKEQKKIRKSIKSAFTSMRRTGIKEKELKANIINIIINNYDVARIKEQSIELNKIHRLILKNKKLIKSYTAQGESELISIKQKENELLEKHYDKKLKEIENILFE